MNNRDKQQKKENLKVHVSPSGTQSVNSIDLLFSQEEKERMYNDALKAAKQ